jgi:hypothetical protein
LEDNTSRFGLLVPSTDGGEDADDDLPGGMNCSKKKKKQLGLGKRTKKPAVIYSPQTQAKRQKNVTKKTQGGKKKEQLGHILPGPVEMDEEGYEDVVLAIQPKVHRTTVNKDDLERRMALNEESPSAQQLKNQEKKDHIENVDRLKEKQPKTVHDNLQIDGLEVSQAIVRESGRRRKNGNTSASSSSSSSSESEEEEEREEEGEEQEDDSDVDEVGRADLNNGFLGSQTNGDEEKDEEEKEGAGQSQETERDNILSKALDLMVGSEKFQKILQDAFKSAVKSALEESGLNMSQWSEQLSPGSLWSSSGTSSSGEGKCSIK